MDGSGEGGMGARGFGEGEVREVLRGRQRREGSGEGGKGLIDAGEDSEE